MTVAACCLATTVSVEGLRALLEGSGGRGSYRDDHPWLVARDLWRASREAGDRVGIVFASGSPLRLSHWGWVETLEVLELHRSSWATACAFTPLEPVNPIFQEVDSLFLQPTAERLQRERVEDIARHRYPLSMAELHPYAICETPPFMLTGHD